MSCPYTGIHIHSCPFVWGDWKTVRTTKTIWKLIYWTTFLWVLYILNTCHPFEVLKNRERFAAFFCNKTPFWSSILDFQFVSHWWSLLHLHLQKHVAWSHQLFSSGKISQIWAGRTKLSIYMLYSWYSSLFNGQVKCDKGDDILAWLSFDLKKKPLWIPAYISNDI